MTNCKTCKHSRFCDTWGEYKCLKGGIRVYKPDFLDCVDYVEDTGKVEQACQCEDCLNRDKEE